MKTCIGGGLLAFSAFFLLFDVGCTPRTGAAPAASADKGAPAAEAADGVEAAETSMLAKVFPSIVRIEAIRLQPSDGRLTKTWVGGSGVILSADGYVLTNCHVAEDADYYRCYLYDGEMLEAKRVGQDAMTDLAVLKMEMSERAKDAAPLKVAEFGDSAALVAGDVVFALGSPGFLSQSSTRGIVANPSMVLPEQTAGQMILRGEDVGMLVRWILHDATIFGGNSGGPLVNLEGDVIGINEIGVFSLSGAIPANLARDVADQLIKTGHVVRGWSGITVQERLESSGKGAGVLVADVAPDSPAQAAGVVPGDVILAVDGDAIEGEKDEAISHYYRMETSLLPGYAMSIEYERGGARQQVRIQLDQRQPAQADDVELRAWGAIVRDLTREVVREERLPDEQGVWFENIRPGGPAGQAEPDLRRQDVLIAVDGKPVHSVSDLKALTDQLMPDESTGTKTVLASVRRNGSVISSVVELRLSTTKTRTPQALKAWLGLASQPLTPKLGTELGIKSDGGARVTRIYPGTAAEKAGLQVGDVILALDGIDVNERRQEDSDVLNRMVRQYRPGTEASFDLWRDGRRLQLPVVLELQPVPTAEMPDWEDLKLEYEVRDIAFDDRVRLQLSPSTKGVLVSNVIRAGWASLAGLRADDVVHQVDGKDVSSVAELQEARNAAVNAGKEWLVMLVERQGETHFVEISLKPLQS